MQFPSRKVGKGSVHKAKASLKGTGPLPSYFGSPELQTTSEVGEDGGTKMAPDKQRLDKVAGEAVVANAITRQDLLDFGTDLKSHFETTMAQKSPQYYNSSLNFRLV